MTESTRVNIEISPKEIEDILKTHFGLVHEIENLTIDWDSKKIIIQVVKKEAVVAALHLYDLKKWNMPVKDLFSERACNCLNGAEIYTIGELLMLPRRDLLRLRNLGKKTLTQIDNILKSFGFTMKDWEKASDISEMCAQNTYKDIFKTFDFYSDLKNDVVNMLGAFHWKELENRKAYYDLPGSNQSLSQIFKGEEQKEGQWKIIFEKYNNKIIEARYTLAIYAIAQKA